VTHELPKNPVEQEILHHPLKAKAIASAKMIAVALN